MTATETETDIDIDTAQAHRTILVVEDSPTERRIVTTFLETQGYRVLSAADGEQALDLASREQPDLVVLDVLLPKKNGFEVCRRLKTDPMTQTIKVLILSAKNQSSDRFWGMRQGADRYLGKPWGEEELLSEVAELLGDPRRPVMAF